MLLQDVSSVKVWSVSGFTPLKSVISFDVSNGPDDSLIIQVADFKEIAVGTEVVLLI
jgi:hypothetical protein